MVLAGVHAVVLGSGGQGVLIPGPGTAGNTHHGIPGHGHPQNGVHPFGAVEHHAEAAVDGPADAGAAAVVEGDVAHAASRVAGVALGGHFGHDVGAVLDVGGLAEGGVGAAGVVVVTAQDHGADLAVAHHLVELQRDVHTAHSVLIQDPALCADHQLVLLGVPDPDVVIVVLVAAVVGQNVVGCSLVGLVKILGVPAQAAPAEGTVAEVKQTGPQNVFHVGGEDKAVQVVLAVAADRGHARVVDGLQEGVAVVEEVGALLVELADHLVVVPQGLVYQLAEALGILVQHFGPLSEGQALGAVTAVVGDVAGGLVGHQIHVDVVGVEVLQQIHDIAVVSHSTSLAGLLMVRGDLHGLGQAGGAVADPALGEAGVDPGVVHLRDDGGSAGNLSGLALGAAHAA